MSKLRSKLARQVMAFILSGAMVMSSMSAYAAPTAKDAVETVEEVKDDDGSSAVEEAPEKTENLAVEDGDSDDGDDDTGDDNDGGGSSTAPEGGDGDGSSTAPEGGDGDGSSTAPEGGDGDGSSTAPEGGDGDGSSTAPEGGDGDGSSAAPDDGDEEKETIVYELKASDVATKVASAEDKTQVTIGEDDFFTVVGKNGSTAISVKADGDAGELEFKLGNETLYKGLGIAWGGSPGISSGKVHTAAGFTVPDGYKADIVIGASAKAKAAIGLYDVYDGKVNIVQNYVLEYEAGDAAVAQFSNIGPGTYYVGNTKKDGWGTSIGGGNSLLYYLRVTLTEVDTVEWKDVKAPVITAEQAEGENEITVSLSNGAIGAHVGYERIKVAMYSDAECNTEALETAYAICDENNKSEIVFKSAKSSGTYYFKAEGIRGDEKKESNVASVEFKYFLTTPSITSLDNVGEGKVDISWGKDDQATGYELEIYTDKELTSKVDASEYTVEEKTVDDDTTYVTKTVSGLSIGTLYYFVVRSYLELGEGTEKITEYSEWSEAERLRVLLEKDPTKYHINEILEGRNLEVNTTYGGEEDIMTFTVLENSPNASDYSADMGMISASANVTIGGVAYKYSVQGKCNPREADGSTTPKGSIPSSGAVFKIESKALSKITFVTGAAAGKPYHFIQVDNETQEVLSDKTDANTPEGSLAFVMEAGYTYYFYLEGSKVKVYDIIYSRYVEMPKLDWTEVYDPVITGVAVSSDGSALEVTVDAVIGTEGGDSLTVEMFDSDGISQGTGISTTEASTHKISITPKKSDSYTFSAKLSRDSEVDADGNEVEYDDKECEYNTPTPFILPLSQPAMSSVTNLGEGKVDVEWGSVKEATGYIVKAYSDAECKTLVKTATTACEFELDEDGEIKVDEKGNRIIKTEAPTNVEMDGFTVGDTYYFTATATRDDDTSKESAAFKKEITQESQLKWSFAAYGSSTSITSTTKDRNGKSIPKNGFEGDYYDGEVTVWSMGGAGKVVPATVDGLAFYYTAIDPNTTNFTLKATAHVNEWVLSNGQDGFGLMAADQVGQNGNGDYLWTNSYQAVVSKIEYNWDGEKVTTDTTKPKISMKIGVGATAKTGATKEDVDQITAGDIDQPKNWSAVQTPLDTTYAKYAKVGITTTCNMVDNAGAWDDKENKWVAKPAPSEASELYVDFELTLQKNNTGYFLSYKMPNGEVMTEKYYDTEALNHIIEDKVYVGFFAARNANVTFKDIEFTTIPCEEDAPPEDQPTKYITLTKTISSASVTNSSDYDLIFASNWDGNLEVRDSSNRMVGKAAVTGSLDTVKAALKDGDNEKDTKAHIEISGLEVGSNVFTLTFTPSKNMQNPPAYTALASYEPVTLTLTVDYRKYGEEGDILYVTPDGKSTGTGTKNEPLDIFTAVKYVQPGQTILLAGGRYSLYKTISISSSISGLPDVVDGKETYSKYIKMIADPEASERPVIDFNGAVTGMTLGGNYWYFKGFDVTRSLDGQKGVQLSGSNNVLDQVNTYKNGNTGIQVSGSSNDTYNYWPQNNLVLNCTSFLNADAGYEDADGFAAKLTIGSGNVFDGCIAAYNADDGWDLFAKIESGQIGSVTIKNCVAYKNGYVLRVGGTDDGALDLEGMEVNAGNGNGFKMGGDGLPGGSIYDDDCIIDEDGNVTYSGHKLINSIAFANKAKGIDSNSCSNNKVYNSISFNNEASNVALYTYTNVQTTGYVVEGVISYRTKSKGVADEISAKNQDASDYTNDATYIWDVKQKASVNASGNKVADDWFVKTTFKGTNTVYPDANNVLLGRYDDGRINMDGFLEFTEKAGVSSDAGLKGDVSATDKDLIGDGQETGGNVSTGNGTIVDDTMSPELSEEQNAVSSELTTNKNYGIYVKYLEEVEYTGTAVTPEFRVYLNGTLFTDYKASYKNNVNAYVAGDERYAKILDTKRPTLILTLNGSYQGTYEYYFDIKPANITDDSLVSVTGLSGTAYPKKFAPTLIYNGKKLSAGKDYDASLDTASGAYKIDASAGTSGNYTGIVEGTYKLLASATDISKAAFKLKTTSANYTGKAIEPEVTIPSGINESDLKIVYSNNVNVGKATVTITGRDDAAVVGSKTLSFTIKKTALKLNDTVTITSSSDSYSYTGAALSPATIKVEAKSVTGAAITIAGVKKGNKDVNEKDSNGLYKYGYTYQYKANTEAGNATLTISGIHNFTGNVNYKFKIIPVAATATAVPAVNGRYVFTNKGLEVGYAPNAEYSPNGTTTSIIVKYNGNTVSTKNYSITYKNNKNAGDSATATVKWKGSLKGTANTEITYTVDPCDFTTGNITAKSVSDVFTNGKSSIKASDLEKSKVVLVNVNKKLTKNRDYRLVYKYQEAGVTKSYDPQDKEAGKAQITIPESTGLEVTVYAIPVGTNYKANEEGIAVAEFRVAYYNIAQAKTQLISKVTGKTTQIYFVDDTETKRANLGALNRLNNHTKNANSDAPYYLLVSHSKAGELAFSNYENKGNETEQKDYTYDYENTATTVAGKQSVTLYGTGKFGGTKVFKYTLVKKTYNLKSAIVDTKTISAVTITNTAEAETAIKAALEGKITMNGAILPTEYIKVSYDASKIQSGKTLKITLTGAVVNGIQVYSGLKSISIKVASAQTPPKEEESSEAVSSEENSSETESSDVESSGDEGSDVEGSDVENSGEESSDVESSKVESSSVESSNDESSDVEGSSDESSSVESSSDESSSVESSSDESSDVESSSVESSSDESSDVESSSDESSDVENSSEPQSETTVDSENTTSSGTSFAQWLRNLFSFR